jgi:ferric-dicitrate binding protein FerR (iron transport regulator)
MEHFHEDFLARYFSRELTGEELAGLRRWLDASPAHVERFRACFKAHHEGKQAGFAGQWDEERAWRRLEARLASGGRRRGSGWRRWGVAALVAGVAGALFLWQFPSRDGTAEGEEARGFPAGRGRAELTLASGERVVLDRREGVVAGDGASVRFRNDTAAARLHQEEGEVTAGESRVHSLFVPEGGEYWRVLPDGTVVWLNSGTTLRFPSRFDRGRREVYLDGEAYLEVAGEEGRPFVVFAGGCEVTVVGTSFNISAYAGDGVIQTTVAGGSVRVRHGGREATLVPGEQCVVCPGSGAFSVERVDARLYTSWVEGKFYFAGYTFAELVRKLERWYDFTMVYATEDIREMHFSGTVNKHRPLEDVLRYLEMTRFIRFTIEGRTVTAFRMHGR